MDKQHTPGPWKIVYEEDFLDGKPTCAIYSALNQTILKSDYLTPTNAQLIATAPGMLDTLIQCHKHLSFLRDSIDGEERLELDESLNLILATIKKAKGNV